MKTDLNFVSFLKFTIILTLLLTINISGALELNIPEKRSEQTEWCWAACCQMVLTYYGYNKTQTEMAKWAFNSSTAQNWPLPLYNNAKNAREGVNCVLNNYALAATGVGKFFDARALNFREIKVEIDDRRPIFILGQSGWNPDTYHIITIIGYENENQPDPGIIFNDPVKGQTGGRKITYLSSVVKTAGIFEWQETLRLQKSGYGGVGIFDGVAIATTLFTYTQPAVARTYTGNFQRKYGSTAFATNWRWSMSFSHSNGEYIVGTANGPAYYTLSTTWNAPSFSLPTNYTWDYAEDGAIIGQLRLSCLDTDGYSHSDSKFISYYPPNPYPRAIAYAFSSVSNSQPEVKAHTTISLQDYSINSGANITFKAGESIIIKDKVTIENGSLSNFIVDPSFR